MPGKVSPMMGATSRVARLFALGMVAVTLTPQPPAEAANSAVVFMYHRFGESTSPSTNIRVDQFEAHLVALREGGYHVLPLPWILSALKRGETLADRTIALTIDDAYLSVYRVAWPRLKAAGIPFTLFVATDPIDRKLASYMSWDQLRELAKAGVTIGSQTASHLHMADSSIRRNTADLRKANARFAAELGQKPRLFAYPYGEASLAIKTLVITEGFIAAFGQHSGVVHDKADFSYLPRFALNEAYGNVERFRMAANSLPLPVSEITPRDPLLTDNPPAFGFTVDPSLKQLDLLACYHGGQGKLRLERLGHRVEVRPKKAFRPGRARINCTMPGPNRRWHWFGMQFYVRKP